MPNSINLAIEVVRTTRVRQAKLHAMLKELTDKLIGTVPQEKDQPRAIPGPSVGGIIGELQAEIISMDDDADQLMQSFDRLMSAFVDA